MAKQELCIGLIGLGQRGLATLRRYAVVEGARVVALADLDAEAVSRGLTIMEQTGQRKPRHLFHGKEGWKGLCQLQDVDLVVVCTDWDSHTPIALRAMEEGHHVAIEVPAATSVADCHRLVEASRQTGRYCTMLENCCYDTFHLGVMEMARRGLFGDICHCEGAYIHDLRDLYSRPGYWMPRLALGHRGNPYPTHGIGPVCQLLEVGGSNDRLVRLVSMSAPNQVNNTLLQTQGGRTVLLQFDERTPRPYSRLQTLCGTRGYAQKYPLPTLQTEEHGLLTGERAEAVVESYWDEPTRRLIDQGRRLGVENTMNYVMDCRLVEALREGRAPDISVEDAALWSCLAELTALSVSRGGQPVEVPHF